MTNVLTYKCNSGIIKSPAYIRNLLSYTYDSDDCNTKNASNRSFPGACLGFLKGGGPISLGSLKKGHQILKGGGPMV